MSNSRMLSAVCAAALFGSISLGFSFQKEQHDQAAKKKANDLQAERAAFYKEVKVFEGEVESKKSYIAAEDYLKAFTTSVSSPLKVRGGSMTAFTSIVGGWEEISETEYCVNVKDSSQIRVEELLDNNGDPTTGTLPNMTVGWVILVIANDPDDTGGHGSSHHHGDSPSGNGLKFTSQNAPCKQHETSQYSILMDLVNPDGSDKVGFYKLSLPTKTPWKDNLRFADKSGGYDPADTGGKLDGEFRERMQSVTIKPVTGSNIIFTCPDGDCGLYLGKPQ